jgi:LEA14-like dessication related protein
MCAVQAALLVIFSACASLSSLIKEPKVSLDSVEITGIDFTGLDLLCRIKVQNTNAVAIPFPHIDWKLFIESETSFLSGAIPSTQTLEARETVVIPLPVHVDYQGLYQTASSLFAAAKDGAESAAYKIDLVISFDLPVLGAVSIPKEIEGTFPLLRLPVFANPSVAVERLDFEKIDLRFSLDVENPNSFDIPFPALSSDYTTLGSSALKTSLDTPPVLGANDASSVGLKLSLSFKDILTSSTANVTETVGLMTVAAAALTIPAFADTEMPPITATNPIVIPKMPVISFKEFEIVTKIPELEVGSIGDLFKTATKGDLTKIDFRFSFEIENKNSFPMTINTFAYRFTVGNSQWAAGTVPARTVNGKQKITVPLNLSIDALNLVKDVLTMVRSHTATTFAFTGNASVSSGYPGLGIVTVPLNLSGTKRF